VERTVKLALNMIGIASPSGSASMVARLGNVLYRTACMLAVLRVAFIFFVTATLPLRDWTIATPVAGAGALIIWTIGWAVRDVPAGH
jgi:hypothetical protein